MGLEKFSKMQKREAHRKCNPMVLHSWTTTQEE